MTGDELQLLGAVGGSIVRRTNPIKGAGGSGMPKTQPNGPTWALLLMGRLKGLFVLEAPNTLVVVSIAIFSKHWL